jgi:hypothetical protein
MKMMKNAIWSCLLIFLYVSCGNEKSSTENSNPSFLKTFFVHGDPAELIAGSTLNQESFIQHDKMDLFNDFYLASVYQFTEKAEVITRSEAIESGNEAAEDDLTKDKKIMFSFYSNGNNFLYSNKERGFGINFKSEYGTLRPFQIVSEDEVINVKVLHYSLLKSKDAFSLLLEARDNEQGKALISITFVRNSAKLALESLSKKYNYLYGPGVPVKWNSSEGIQLHVCGHVSKKVDEIYLSSVNKTWSDIFKYQFVNPTKINFTAVLDEKYPPFSDLNHHCIYSVNNYLTYKDKNYINSASTINIADTNKGQLLDSDIFVWGKELSKFGVPFGDDPTFKRSIVHEIGHFLGLHHQFDGTASVMSYDVKHDFISSYDIEAINALYQ